ncbi:YveK family protein [Heyndrickxia oleronia]|jgi:capsular polysaccharide biosynthesis protein|uniref:YveK family protein n=1 Tax=Heyndrickxia oleronia TaxID=38875 RepID=UPI00242E165D|nr:Wzz/FepE/Etk N-terminal domain-containing protein [Heyndrickxia oleronia]MCI1590674.1 Wzz/FepE/Etk N-terminal domain-containing protein [Heyndrickxia oleronia]MCI1612137.1 Wzz/FepE/Etk N-terminal domain-containing protein [Heyndrickxia oleronia]MCI1759846.1 Wzz/FepE/Etk N-terminal domain-containing protein [Heyndrickxia oleronia]
MEESISLKEVIQTIIKRWKLIVLISLLAMLLSGSITFYLLTPKYQASTQILVNQKNVENKLDYSQMQSNVSLINTYREIIKSPTIIEKVIKKLDLKQSTEQLNQKITINSSDNSQVFSVTVQDNNPGLAVAIVNSVSEIFQKEIKGIMNVDNVSILAKAEMKNNPSPVNPNPLLNIAIGFIVGFLFGIGLVFLIEYFDNTLKNSQDVENFLGLPILGSIQNIPQRKGRKRSEIRTKEVETFGA